MPTSSDDTVIEAADSDAIGQRAPPSWRFPNRKIATVLLILLLCVAIWMARLELLQVAADLWIVDDPMISSDVGVVLGGGLDTRPFAAAELYRRGLVKRIIVSQVPDDPATRLGIISSNTMLNIAVLGKLGVPTSVIETFGKANASTEEEVVSLRKWIIRNNVTSIIVPTEIFSSRRVRWAMHRQLDECGVRISIEAVNPIDYRRVGWWRNEEGLIAFQNEVIKYLYYRAMY